jgi:hydrogenase/urease accessory protein HupE
VLLGAVAPAAAHPLSVSYSRFVVSADAVQAVIRVPMDDVDLLLRLDRDLDGKVSAAEIEQARGPIARYLTDHVRVFAAGRPLDGAYGGGSTWTDAAGALYLEAALTYGAHGGAVSDVSIEVSVLTDLYGDHRTLSEIAAGGRREEFVFQHGNRYVAPQAGRSSWQTAWSFIRLGVEHIFTGYDHILFLFGVLLVGGGTRNLVLIVTSFTIAHSLTLSLATFGFVHPAAWTVEAAIALSIAYIGLENLFVRDGRHRWRITFAFGLIHGLGFANVLREMALPPGALAISLFTFNVGVEIGQIAIVGLMVPVLRLLERTPYRVPVTRAVSAAIVAVGLFWFWQRI